jgi:hypothetical protein
MAIKAACRNFQSLCCIICGVIDRISGNTVLPPRPQAILNAGKRAEAGYFKHVLANSQLAGFLRAVYLYEGKNIVASDKYI